jgi:hypothetical protein
MSIVVVDVTFPIVAFAHASSVGRNGFVYINGLVGKDAIVAFQLNGRKRAVAVAASLAVSIAVSSPKLEVGSGRGQYEITTSVWVGSGNSAVPETMVRLGHVTLSERCSPFDMKGSMDILGPNVEVEVVVVGIPKVDVVANWSVSTAF